MGFLRNKPKFGYRIQFNQMMNTAISEGVQVTVYTQFRPDLSVVDQGCFFHNYRIEIINNNNFKIQLLHRDWYIFDSLKEATFVSGHLQNEFHHQ